MAPLVLGVKRKLGRLYQPKGLSHSNLRLALVLLGPCTGTLAAGCASGCALDLCRRLRVPSRNGLRRFAQPVARSGSRIIIVFVNSSLTDYTYQQ